MLNAFNFIIFPNFWAMISNYKFLQDFVRNVMGQCFFICTEF